MFGICKVVLKAGTSVGHPFTWLNEFSDKIKPPAIHPQRAFWAAFVNLALLFRIDAKLIEKAEEVLWVDSAPLSREVSAIGAPTPFSIPTFQLAVGPSGLLAVVPDCLIPRLNLLHAAVYYELGMGAHGVARTIERLFT